MDPPSGSGITPSLSAHSIALPPPNRAGDTWSPSLRATRARRPPLHTRRLLRGRLELSQPRHAAPPHPCSSLSSSGSQRRERRHHGEDRRHGLPPDPAQADPRTAGRCSSEQHAASSSGRRQSSMPSEAIAARADPTRVRAAKPSPSCAASSSVSAWLS